MEKIVIKNGKITNVYQPQRHVYRGGGAGKDAVIDSEPIGWFITVNHIHSFFVGHEKPKIEKGQRITIILQSEEPEGAEHPQDTRVSQNRSPVKERT